MKTLTLVPAHAVAVFLICGSLPSMQAADTKVTVKDGSILLRAEGLDAGSNWTLSKAEVRHRNTAGVLYQVQITEAGADRCGGDITCGIDTSRAWKIQITYNTGSVTLLSLSSNKGLHLVQHNLPFDKWRPTANADERQFGDHADGYHITGVKVNNGASLCTNSCEVTVTYQTP